MTTKKNITPITIGETIFPKKIPNLNHKIFKGVNSLEFMNPKVKKITAIIIAHNLYVLISSKGQKPIMIKTTKKTIPKFLLELLFISIIYTHYI